MLATPGPNGDAVLEAAVVAAARAGLVGPKHHVVVLQQIHEDFCVKVMSLNSSGSRVAGSKVQMVGRTITAVKTGLSSTRGGSTGALVDSDDDSEEDAEPDFDAAGSFRQSASMLYKANGRPRPRRLLPCPRAWAAWTSPARRSAPAALTRR
ncbi:hypothetical protein COO60DRAFT_99442 [Scenedesmus sp. NREL 46B-D3]|nr:hypothetical protein COO60DRAFT_99442 [Scenedesmus sp. NREL 46B-D3]